jgi:hypothetical protein
MKGLGSDTNVYVNQGVEEDASSYGRWRQRHGERDFPARGVSAPDYRDRSGGAAPGRYALWLAAGNCGRFYCCRTTRKVDDAADLLQRVAIGAWRGYPTFRRRRRLCNTAAGAVSNSMTPLNHPA